MSKVGMRHLTKNPYGGLAFGKGPLTSSTSPLWSPHGAYSYGGFYGEADAAANGATNDAGKKNGLVAKLTQGETTLPIIGIAVPTIALTIAAGYYLFFSKNAPLGGMTKRLNPWSGDKDAHRSAALIRWGNSTVKEDNRKKLAKRAGLSLADSKKRSARGVGAKGLKDRYKRYAKYYAERSAKSAAKKKKYEIKMQGKRRQFFVDGKRVTLSSLGKNQKAVFDNMKKGGQKTLTANPRRRKNALKVTNPRRRKNAIKKTNPRRRKNAIKKTNPRRRKNALKVTNPRRRRNSAAQRAAQKRAAKAMRLYHSGKAKTLKAAYKMVN